MGSAHADRLVVAAREMAERAAGTELEHLAADVCASAEAIARHCADVQQALVSVLTVSAVAARLGGIQVDVRQSAVGERVDEVVTLRPVA